MYNNERKTYVTEIIREMPAISLISLPLDKLNEMENEIHSEIHRTKMALRWIQGVKRIKAAKNGGGDGE